MKNAKRVLTLIVAACVLFFGFSTLAEHDPAVCEDLREELRECREDPDSRTSDEQAIVVALIGFGCWFPFPIVLMP